MVNAPAAVGGKIIAKVAPKLRPLVDDLLENFYDNHHIVTREVAGMMKALGVPHMPEFDYVVPLPRWWHRHIHSGEGFGPGGMYNKMWKEWLSDISDQGRLPSRDDVRNQMEKIIGFFSLMDGV